MTSSSSTAIFRESTNYGSQVGQNYGTMNIAFNGRSESPPIPSSYISFRKDPHFVDRGDLLDQVYEKCFENSSWTALVGLGGVGKSQLANEYCHRIHRQEPNRWIFWIYANSLSRFEQGFREMADIVRIPERAHPQANIFKLVHDWLCHPRNQKWLLVLDNVDDASFLRKPSLLTRAQQSDSPHGGLPQAPITYLPRNADGSILITTRTKNVALELVEVDDIIDVNPMDETQSVALIHKKLDKPGTSKLLEDRQQVVNLATALEFMPLAIVQATAYIYRRAPRCSIKQYLDQFWSGDRGAATLLDHEGGYMRRDVEATNSIIRAWQISFNHIRQNWPSAADLLSLMSFFDRKGIPEELLCQRDEKGNGPRNGRVAMSVSIEDKQDDTGSRQSDFQVSNQFEQDVTILRDYSFISASMDASAFEMHGLVQLATRSWLEAHGQLERWKQQYVKRLYDNFPPFKYINFQKCQLLFPHVKLAATQQPVQDDSLGQWAMILHHAAGYALFKGNTSEAEKLLKQATSAMLKVYGPRHMKTLICMQTLANAYTDATKWNQAEELLKRVVSTQEDVLGPDDVAVAFGALNLARVHSSASRWEKAEKLYEKAYGICSRATGQDAIVDKAMTRSLMGLAGTYVKLNRLIEAQTLYEGLLVTKLGDYDLNPLTCTSDLAVIYYGQGRYSDAEALGLKVVEASKKILGDEHPETLTSLANLACTIRELNRQAEAQELLTQVLAARKTILGAEHPVTLMSMFNLACTWKALEKRAEALELVQEALNLQRRVLGLDHPDTQRSVEALEEWQSEERQNDQRGG